MSLTIYASGAMLIARLGAGWLAVCLACALWLEYRVLKGSCVNCVYYGKRCAFGKGVICSWLLKKGSLRRFSGRKISWKDLLPDLAIAFVPLIVGITYLVIDFRWTTLGLVVILGLACSVGNSQPCQEAAGFSPRMNGTPEPLRSCRGGGQSGMLGSCGSTGQALIRSIGCRCTWSSCRNTVDAS